MTDFWWFKKPKPIESPKKKVRFIPQKDITVYELLHIPGVMHLNKLAIGHVWPHDDYYEQLPDSIKRHFVEFEE